MQLLHLCYKYVIVPFVGLCAHIIVFAIICRWLEKVDAEPGLNISMINALKEKLRENPEEYTK